MTRIALFAFVTASGLLLAGAMLGVSNVPAPGLERTAMVVTLAEG